MHKTLSILWDFIITYYRWFCAQGCLWNGTLNEHCMHAYLFVKYLSANMNLVWSSHPIEYLNQERFVPLNFEWSLFSNTLYSFKSTLLEFFELKTVSQSSEANFSSEMPFVGLLGTDEYKVFFTAFNDNEIKYIISSSFFMFPLEYVHDEPLKGYIYASYPVTFILLCTNLCSYKKWIAPSIFTARWSKIFKLSYFSVHIAVCTNQESYSVGICTWVSNGQSVQWAVFKIWEDNNLQDFLINIIIPIWIC